MKERKENHGEPHKRGAPEGHDGDTRTPPKPTNYKDLKPSEHCAGKGVEILDSYRKVIEDVEIRPIATEFTIYRYRCLGCGRIFETKDANLPRSGVFGPTYSGFMTSLHYLGGMPFNKLSLISGTGLGIEITTKGMQDVIYRSAEIFEQDFRGIEDAVKHSKYTRSDETSYPFNREKWWAWNISNGIENVVTIRPSRGANVIESYIGEDYDGVLQCDFFKSYQG
ncbi:IS66 family element, transposase, partial [mine drainage metagenome]